VAKLTKKEQRLQQAREELGIKAPKKPRKKRKPMTEEQRAAAIERLAKARAARGITGTKNVHPDVLALPEDNELCYKNVKEWLDYNKDVLKSIKSQEKSVVSKERQEFQVVRAYIKNIQIYLKDNVWLDHRSGKTMENTVKQITITPSATTVYEYENGEEE
jgi:hypothetical protein